jgi:hypothetical protein
MDTSEQNVGHVENWNIRTIIKCGTCPQRIDLRSKYIRNLRYYLENSRLHDTAINVITTSIGCYFDGYDVPELQEMAPEANELLIRAFEDQEAIGWDQWFKGRLAKSWGAVYEFDLAHLDHRIPLQTPQKWVKTIITDIFEFDLQSWSIRNDIEHGVNEDPLARRKEKIITKIMWQKDKIDYFPNRYLENLNMEDLQTLPLDNLIMTECQFDILIRASKRKTCVPRDTEIE